MYCQYNYFIVYIVNIKLEEVFVMSYMLSMPRPKKGKDKRSEPVTVLLPEGMYNEIVALCMFYDRSESYICYRLIERGLAAYSRDRKLMEGGQPGDIDRIPIDDILEDEKAKKRKRA